MKSGTSRRGRPRTFDADEALDAAMKLFWEKGYTATSLKDLTSALRIAPPSLYAAFGSKEELFVRAVRVYAETHGAYIRRALDEEPTALDAIARILREAAVKFTAREHPRGCLIIAGALDVDENSDKVRKLLEGMRREKARWMQRRIEADVRVGVLPAGADARALASFADAVLEGLCLQARRGASRAELQAAAEVAIGGLRAVASKRR